MSENNKNFIWYFKKSRKTQIIVAVVILILAVSLGGYFIFKSGKKAGNGTNTSEDEETQVRRQIDGLLVEKGRSNLFPVGVMIENLYTIRPQSGLSRANVIYEALVEGGITRFLALYGSGEDIKEIAPVRSARPYYLDWILEYDAMYVHAGGSSSALEEIAGLDLKDLNALYEGPYFWRDTGESAPHNLITSTELLARAILNKNYPESGNFESWLFKDDAALSERPEGEKNITIDFSSFNYKVEFKYDRNNNDYVRFQGGLEAKSKEENGEVVLKAKNIVVQFVETRLVDESRLGLTTVGEGEAIVFRDGQAVSGVWKKDSRASRTRFYDETGDEIRLNAGTTWIEILPTGRQVEYN